MTRAPRIDTVRNQVTATRTLLGSVLEELEDLHVLAYDRPSARADAGRVRGGERDYALDTHGDPRAREAYAGLSTVVDDVCGQLAIAADDVIRLLREGGSPDESKGRRRISVEELAEQLEHQALRIKRGEYEPVRTHAQPEAEAAGKVLDRVRRERDEARRLVERQAKDLQRLTERLAQLTPASKAKTW